MPYFILNVKKKQRTHLFSCRTYRKVLITAAWGKESWGGGCNKSLDEKVLHSQSLTNERDQKILSLAFCYN